MSDGTPRLPKDKTVNVDTRLNPLAKLIADRRAERRLSYADIAKKGGLPKSTVHKLATTVSWTFPPSTVTLDRLARGLELPSATVRKAASEAVGLTAHVIVDPSLDTLVGSIEMLTEDQRAQVSALVDAMMRGNIQQ